MGATWDYSAGDRGGYDTTTTAVWGLGVSFWGGGGGGCGGGCSGGCEAKWLCGDYGTETRAGSGYSPFVVVILMVVVVMVFWFGMVVGIISGFYDFAGFEGGLGWLGAYCADGD